MIRQLLLFVFLCLCFSGLRATEDLSVNLQDSLISSSDSAFFIPLENCSENSATATAEGNPNRIVKKIRDHIKKRKKIISACLAFPVPFGIIGGHRIYLGTKPYVPLIYILTLGGACGILPFVDFVVILLDKDIGRFEKNDKVFMWVK